MARRKKAKEEMNQLLRQMRGKVLIVDVSQRAKIQEQRDSLKMLDPENVAKLLENPPERIQIMGKHTR